MSHTFLSLEEFLSIKDPYSAVGSSVFISGAPANSLLNWKKGYSFAEDMLIRYNIAKESYILYGESPPIDSNVFVLNGRFSKRVFKGPYLRDERYFYMTTYDEEFNCEREFLIIKPFWWAEVASIEVINKIKKDIL